MQYEYTREHMMPIVMELTYEDLRNIQKMAEAILKMEEKPEDLYTGAMRRLEREAKEAMAKAAQATQYAFPKPE